MKWTFFLLTLFPLFTQAKHLIVCEGVKVSQTNSVPATLMLFPRSTLDLSTSTAYAHYHLRILENNFMVNALPVFLDWKFSDNKGNPDRFAITSQRRGQAKGLIVEDFSIAFLEIRTSTSSQTYQFGNCSRNF